jgi:hypothetical protein
MYTVLYSPVNSDNFYSIKNYLFGRYFFSVSFLANINEAGKSETKRQKQE